MTRAAFETWISSPPYERSVYRWPDDAECTAWPGYYWDSIVQIAWKAWEEATRQAREEGET